MPKHTDAERAKNKSSKFKFENNGNSQAGRARQGRNKVRKLASENIGRALFLDRLLPDDEFERKRKEKKRT